MYKYLRLIYQYQLCYTFVGKYYQNPKKGLLQLKFFIIIFMLVGDIDISVRDVDISIGDSQLGGWLKSKRGENGE